MRENCKYYETCGNEENCIECSSYEPKTSEDIKKEIPLERMSEIAIQTLDAMFEAEPYEAIEFCREILDLTETEIDYLVSECNQKYFNEEDDYDDTEV